MIQRVRWSNPTALKRNATFVFSNLVHSLSSPPRSVDMSTQLRDAPGDLLIDADALCKVLWYGDSDSASSELQASAFRQPTSSFSWSTSCCSSADVRSSSAFERATSERGLDSARDWYRALSVRRYGDEGQLWDSELFAECMTELSLMRDYEAHDLFDSLDCATDQRVIPFELVHSLIIYFAAYRNARLCDYLSKWGDILFQSLQSIKSTKQPTLFSLSTLPRFDGSLRHRGHQSALDSSDTSLLSFLLPLHCVDERLLGNVRQYCSRYFPKLTESALAPRSLATFVQSIDDKPPAASVPLVTSPLFASAPVQSSAAPLPLKSKALPPISNVSSSSQRVLLPVPTPHGHLPPLRVVLSLNSSASSSATVHPLSNSAAGTNVATSVPNARALPPLSTNTSIASAGSLLLRSDSLLNGSSATSVTVSRETAGSKPVAVLNSWTVPVELNTDTSSVAAPLPEADDVRISEHTMHVLCRALGIASEHLNRVEKLDSKSETANGYTRAAFHRVLGKVFQEWDAWMLGAINVEFIDKRPRHACALS